MITQAPRIVTSRVGLPDSFTLERYLATGGYEGLRKALSMAPADVAAEVNKASLLGRGGAGFPAGRKWSMLRKATTTYLVVNGDESEPATFKDHMLIERDPHQIIEGTAIAAYATGVELAFIYCRGEFALGLERLQQACNEAYEHGALGADVLGSGYALDIVIHPGAGAYICGEETALLESLEGKRGFPRIKPPFFPAAVGLYGEPTVVNNVETVSNLPWIIAHGGDGFTALGEGSSTGTRLFALSGRVEHPGWFEIEMSKTTFRDLIYDPSLGGGIPGGKNLRAFIPGGVSAPWFGPGPARSGAEPGRGGAGRLDARVRIGRRDGLRHVPGPGGLADRPVLLPRIVRPVHAVQGGERLDREDHAPPRAGPGSRGGHRPRARRLRQPVARTRVAAEADDDLRVRPVDSLCDRLGGQDVPRRVARARQRGRCPFPPDTVRRG